MVCKGLDPVVISKLTSYQVEQVTCLECCKYYIAPETAACGHTLCHSCWKGRRACHTCAAPIDRKQLRLNLPLQTLTQHVHALAEAFEKLFNVKLEEFTFDFLDNLQSEDPSKHVKEWLANSENQFSAPAASSQITEPESINHMEKIKSKAQIHINKSKTKSPKKVVKAPEIQEDWDKIDVLPDTEEPKEHVIGPMDIEQFFTEDDEYTNDNPRRSSRKRELKTDSHPPTNELSVEKNSTKNSTSGTRSIKNKQLWNSVKKMRKEFSKLNNMNKSKLNVSIEMCRKGRNAVNKSKQAQTLLHTDTDKINVVVDDTLKIYPNQDDKKDDEVNSSKQNCHEEHLLEAIDKSNLISSPNARMEKEITEKSVLYSHNKSNDVFNINNEFTVGEKANNEHYGNVPFIKKSALPQNKTSEKEKDVQITQKNIEIDSLCTNTDDIEISVRVGNTVTNIVIKNKKRNDVEMKVNTDKEIQTNLGPYALVNKNDAGCSPMTHLQLNIDENNKVEIDKTHSTKKNTDSADTAPIATTAPFEITDSIERELSDVMEHLEHKRNRSGITQITSCPAKSPVKHTQSEVPIHKQQHSVVLEHSEYNHSNNKQGLLEKSASEVPLIAGNDDNGNSVNEIPTDMEDLNDIDIFNSGSIKEANVKLLKDTKVASEILMLSVKTKKSQKMCDKRERGVNDDIELPCSKKQKIDLEQNTKNDKTHNDSVPMNYDVIMSQVFAKIDADIHNTSSNYIEKTQTQKQKINESIIDRHKLQLQASQIIHKTQTKISHKDVYQSRDKNCSNSLEDDQKYSENVFSILEKNSEPHNISGKNNDKLPASTTTQQHIDNLLTPGMCRNLAATRDIDTQLPRDEHAAELIDATPVIDNDGSESVVEETPQKGISFSKTKQSDTVKAVAESQKVQGAKTTDSQIIRSIINISDTTMDTLQNKDTTVVDVEMKRISLQTKDQALETPLTINKFVDHIKHNSTPVARKSLHFDSEQDPEQTMCPTTTQEKEFLSDAFKNTQISPIKKALKLKNTFSKPVKTFFIAGSCLTHVESKNLKMLCTERGWTFLDKYTKELTHLVVGVDEENKSQRSVKYMCALAASKWIVTFAWVESCLLTKTVVDEAPYEALDACGEPGPKLSRISIKKVFEGISFYCMPPFNLLEIDTLKEMLEAAGGRVVDDPVDVYVTEENCTRPALLLAEPEHTQEDKFIYFAMEHKVVPVNFEWALNCLGYYSLCSIYELLLCPFSILPSHIRNWPAALIQQESQEE